MWMDVAVVLFWQEALELSSIKSTTMYYGPEARQLWLHRELQMENQVRIGAAAVNMRRKFFWATYGLVA